jgi:hypothetical protein
MLKWPKKNESEIQKIQISIVGDQGGKNEAKSTKIGIQLINLEHPNSPANVSILAIYPGQDSRENLLEFGRPIWKQIKEMMEQKIFKLRFDYGEEGEFEIEWYFFD